MVVGLILGILFWGNAWAEDELSFLTPHKQHSKPHQKVIFEQPFPIYLVDLNSNGEKERIHFVNRDGKDWLSIKSREGKEMASYHFQAVGLDATPFKIWLRSLSSSSKVLIIYYYEGYTNYLKFMGSVRLYFLTFENNDLKTLSMRRGPPIFYEHSDKDKSYRQRRYKVEVSDYNGDGRRDILVKYNYITDIFLYQGEGKWLHQTRPVI